jgi:hypothetical protein
MRVGLGRPGDGLGVAPLIELPVLPAGGERLEGVAHGRGGGRVLPAELPITPYGQLPAAHVETQAVPRGQCLDPPEDRALAVVAVGVNQEPQDCFVIGHGLERGTRKQ